MKLRFKRGRPDNLETLHPAYFALVMATGIVAIATYMHGVPLVPTVLFWLNVFFFAGLVAATGARILRYPAAFAADVRSHSRGVGFFTMVAACGVFGNQLLLQMEAVGLATFFWAVAGVLWLVVTYGLLAVLTVKPDKPSLADGLNGGWLVSVVATQSVSILTVLMLRAGDERECPLGAINRHSVPRHPFPDSRAPDNSARAGFGWPRSNCISGDRIDD